MMAIYDKKKQITLNVRSFYTSIGVNVNNVFDLACFGIDFGDYGLIVKPKHVASFGPRIEFVEGRVGRF